LLLLPSQGGNDPVKHGVCQRGFYKIYSLNKILKPGSSDLLAGIREVMSFLGNFRGFIQTAVEVIRAFKSGGLPAGLVAIERVLTEWQS